MKKKSQNKKNWNTFGRDAMHSLFISNIFSVYIFQSGGAIAKRPEITVLLKQTTNMLGSNSYGLTYEAPKTELK